VRNKHVETAVDLIVELLDRLSAGDVLGDPAPAHLKDIFDAHVKVQGGSVKLACVFLTAYSLKDKKWKMRSVPTGIRGKYGDKKLANALTLRHVTFHNSITAFGENLGWKGNVQKFELKKDERFWPFLSQLVALSVEERTALLNHVVWRLHSSRLVPEAMPPLPNSYLSYARSLRLCDELLAIPSEGHIPQFLVAAFLKVHRARLGNKIVTHHPHAADTYNNTCGDIEEFKDSELVAAYEVTVRPDWKNRLADFGKKLSASKLPKYVIFASGVRSDPELFPASHLVTFVESLPFDLAVVDISDFFSVFCAELSREEIARAINQAYKFLCEPHLCGRADFQAAYKTTTDRWLET
jgi:hypothetical protein